MLETKKIKAIALDMDGLLFDTEPFYKAAWMSAARKLNYSIDEDLYSRFIGVSTSDCEVMLQQVFGEEFPAGDFRAAWQLKHKNLIKNGVDTKPGFAEIMHFCSQSPVPFALVTSSLIEDVNRHFNAVGQIQSCFATIITGDCVSRGKPLPDIYLMAAERMGVSPNQMLVLEDSNQGMRSAIAAGCIAVMIPDLISPKQDVMKNAYAVLNELNEFFGLPLSFVPED